MALAAHDLLVGIGPARTPLATLMVWLSGGWKSLILGIVILTMPLVFEELLGFDSSIGNAEVSHFNVTFDNDVRLVYFEVTGKTQLSDRLNGYGLIVDKPVIDIIAGSSTEHSAVGFWDRLVKIEGRPSRDNWDRVLFS